MKKLFYFTLCSLLFCSCASSKKAVLDNKPLIGTYWELISINKQPIPDGQRYTPNITFENDRYYGNLGCNRFFGSYFCTKKKISLEYSGATKMLCEEMSAEKMFSNALKQEIDSYIIEKDTLILFSKNKEVMRFKSAMRPPTES